jgi:protein-S-isoprenylcysteine O-methyltransferase Ste14
MRKFWSVIGSAVFFVIAPGSITGLLPWSINGWQFHPAFFGLEWSRAIGAILVVLGFVPLLNSFARFALEGLGTPAPIAPPQHLVVTGFYRHVRNPMYVGLTTVILGEALLFADLRLVWYGLVVWAFFHVWVLVVEEPTLRSLFGDEYRTFCGRVPRWFPRLTPDRG